MAGHILKLRGCTTEPLGNYLKGLGIFRLVSEQADANARAWWKNGFLHVFQNTWTDTTDTSAEAQCVNWLSNGCQFTPLIAPWQKNTGYLPSGKRGKGGQALSELLRSDHTGANAFKNAFFDFAHSVGVNLPNDSGEWLESVKASKVDLSATELLQRIRNSIRSSECLDWIDAVGISASRSSSKEDPSWFPLLGMGGGEKSGQYIVNQQQRLRDLLASTADEVRKDQLESALFSENRVGALETGLLSAMYYPRYVKNWNSTQDLLPVGERCVNPWDFVLLLEGCLIWSASTTRRRATSRERASFPFYCRASFGGSMNLTAREVHGAEKSISKGELWCPIWSSHSSLSEIRRILAEGRLQLRHKTSSRSLDFALAATGIGVDRGVSAFQRYSVLGRSGSYSSQDQTVLLAVNIGCIAPKRSPTHELLGQLRPFAEEISRTLNHNTQQPRRLVLARIAFERAWFDACSFEAEDFESRVELMVAAGRIMMQLGTNKGKPGVVKTKRGNQTSEKEISPVNGLRNEWFVKSSETVQEYRLARAIAGITSWGEKTAHGRVVSAVDSVRSNLLPVVRRGKRWLWDATNRSAVWLRGASVEANLAAVLRRRLIDSEKGAGDGLPLWGSYGAGFAELLALWRGEVDPTRLTELIHGLSLVDVGSWADSSIGERQLRDEPTPDLQTTAVKDEVSVKSIQWNNQPLVTKENLRAAFQLPRSYHLLKLCFVGGRLPHRPVEGQTVARTGSERYPSSPLDILTMLQAGRLTDACIAAARRLRAKGYPALLREVDLETLTMPVDDCRRLAGLLLIPVRQPGVCAALSIKPEPSRS